MAFHVGYYVRSSVPFTASASRILSFSKWSQLLRIVAENTHRWGKDHCTAGLQFNKTGLYQGRNYVVFVCSEATESKLVKLETSCTVILPPKVKVP